MDSTCRSCPDISPIMLFDFLFFVCRWRDVKMRAFEDADHRTYVDLKVPTICYTHYSITFIMACFFVAFFLVSTTKIFFFGSSDDILYVTWFEHILLQINLMHYL